MTQPTSFQRYVMSLDPTPLHDIHDLGGRESLVRAISSSLVNLGVACPPLDGFTEDELREAVAWIRGYMVRRGSAVL
jgi:hypothetical protein